MTSDKNGFSLLEMVVCMGLLVLLAALVLRGSGQGLMQLLGAGERDRCLDYAISIMEELRARPEHLSEVYKGSLSASERGRIFYCDDLEAELQLEWMSLSDYISPAGELEEMLLYHVALKVYPQRHPQHAVELRSLIIPEGDTA